MQIILLYAYLEVVVFIGDFWQGMQGMQDYFIPCAGILIYFQKKVWQKGMRYAHVVHTFTLELPL